MSRQKKPLILIVDDNPENLKVLAQVVEDMHSEVALAMSGREMLSFLNTEKPDLILLDVMMPEMDGFEICRKIKAKEETRDIPIIFITAKTDLEDIVKGFQAGAVDYVGKPFNQIELNARINTHLQIKKYRDSLKEMVIKLELMSMTDALTGVYNRRYMMEELKKQQKRLERNQTVFSIGICDLDGFKYINDTFGHDCGDFILKAVAEIVQDSIRSLDVFGRWGGEEFLLLFPETDAKGAQTACENIRSRIQDYTFNFNGTEIKITITFGVSTSHEGSSTEQMIKEADQALYQGKGQGKNCVVAF